MPAIRARRRLLATLCAAATFFVMVDATSNAVTRMPLDEMARQATIVVIGKVTEVTSRETPEGFKYSRFKTQTVLKGDAPSEFEILRSGSIAEFNPDCCVADGIYLLFLQPAVSGGYAVVNGPFGVTRVDAPSDRSAE